MMLDNGFKTCVKLVTAACILFSVASCNSGNSAPIKASVMQAILFDFTTVENYASLKMMPGAQEKNRDTLSKYYALVLQKHHISKEDFSMAMDWYLNHPEEAKIVFDKVVDTATFFKKKYAKSKPMEMDSESSVDNTKKDTTAPSLQNTLLKDKPGSNNDLNVKNREEPLASPVDKNELLDIKKRNKEKRDALNKVKNEN